MDCANCKGFYLLIVRNGIFRLRNFQIIAVPSCMMVDLLNLWNRVFKVLNVFSLKTEFVNISRTTTFKDSTTRI